MKRKARIGKSKIKQLIACFAEDLTAAQTAKLVEINRNTANSWYRRFREKILARQENNTPFFKGEIELDESYFGGPRKKKHTQDRRKRGRGAENKVPVFGILKRNGKVYVQIIKNADKSTLLPIIKQIIKKKSTIYTDKWRSYDGRLQALPDKSFQRVFRQKGNPYQRH